MAAYHFVMVTTRKDTVRYTESHEIPSVRVPATSNSDWFSFTNSMGKVCNLRLMALSCPRRIVVVEVIDTLEVFIYRNERHIGSARRSGNKRVR